MAGRKRSLTGWVALTLLLVLALLVLAGCGGSPGGKEPSGDPEQGAAAPVNPKLILATTTSTYDTGLLDYLLPIFERESGYQVTPLAKGTGEALALAGRGEADVVLVHAPQAEEEYVASGDVINRRLVMHNDFVLVGPPEDPAAIKGLTAAQALGKIAAAGAPFASRGDDSGTNKMELQLWQVAGIEATGNKWYLETGEGMGQTLNLASEQGAYTLTDRGTYLALRQNLRLEILVQGEEALKNIYHVMQVNPEKHPEVNGEGAGALAAFFVRPDVQQLIADFGVDKYGQPLFFPDAS